MKTYWLSFCDPDRPPGTRFLGVCVVDVTVEMAAEAFEENLVKYPNALPGAEWIAAACKQAWRLGCNPGGEVASYEVPEDHLEDMKKAPRGKLMSHTELQSIGLSS